jgi:hypothetical protein
MGGRMAIEQNRQESQPWPAAAEADGRRAQVPGWRHRLVALLLVLFCFEMGVFLLLFPWLEAWNQNYFASLSASWYGIWSSPYFRGAVSGLGLIDIAISFSALFRLRRFAIPD